MLENILKELSEAINYFDSVDDFETSEKLFEVLTDIKEKYNIDD